MAYSLAMSLNEVVTARVKMLVALDGKGLGPLARSLGLSRPSLSHRLAGRVEWTLSDVDAVAEYYGEERGYLLGMVDRLPKAAASGWAPRGSNPQPTVWESAQVIPLRRGPVAA